MIKIYGDEPDISHLPKEQQAEIKKQIARRSRELRRDIEKMKMPDFVVEQTIENLGWIERPIVEFWAFVKAHAYCLRSPLDYQVATECRHIEDRNKRNRYGEPLFYERLTWIGVTSQDDAGHVTAVKTFFGKSRFLE